MPPKPNEEYIGIITKEVYAGSRYSSSSVRTSSDVDDQTTMTDEELYEKLLETARYKYSSQYTDHGIALRNFKSSIFERKDTPPDAAGKCWYLRIYKISADVVVPTNTKSISSNTRDEEDENPLPRALDKALQDIREGSRIAIDQVKVLSGMDKNEYKDQIVEILLDKGYKVVAKEYLEKLYDEQQAQQSGIYNDRTTVKENNFSAVGYYLNVRLTETSLRVQVINVSTGEYDANVTIKL